MVICTSSLFFLRHERDTKKIGIDCLPILKCYLKVIVMTDVLAHTSWVVGNLDELRDDSTPEDEHGVPIPELLHDDLIGTLPLVRIQMLLNCILKATLELPLHPITPCFILSLIIILDLILISFHLIPVAS